ncbi:MAG: hypothetical protein CL666_09375 [Balneola sp.]|nr:hypothetical protein [Balneola sp.]|tara:strand:+ start:152866 stop:153159 length:294 start_codon:yes stop_codon:yes gene_type:complete
MNKGILAWPENLGNSEVGDYISLLSSPKVTASRSFCPSKGTQVLTVGYNLLLGQNCINRQEPISLWREIDFSFVPNYSGREDRVRKGRKVKIKTIQQ